MFQLPQTPHACAAWSMIGATIFVWAMIGVVVLKERSVAPVAASQHKQHVDHGR